jgi:DNA polymerase III subunit delta
MPTPVSASEFLRARKPLPEAPVYAVFGPQDFLRESALAMLAEQLRGRGLEVRRAAEQDSIAAVLDELRSPSLFGGRFALVLRNRREGNRQEATTRFKEELAAYLEAPSRRNVLVFDAATFARNLSVPKSVCAKYPTVICEDLKPWDARGWEQLASAEAARHGLRLDRESLTALRESSGANLSRAAQELGKLALLCPSGRVSAGDVARACGFEGTDATFPLCDAVLTGNRAQALQLAAKLAGKAEVGGLLSLFALLRLQVGALGRAALALASGKTGAEAVALSRARLREPMKAGFVKAASRLQRRDVQAAVEVLVNADETIKTSSVDSPSLLMTTVARLCESLHGDRPFTDPAR